MLQLCKVRTFGILQKYAPSPYFAAKSHTVMVHQWSTHNDDS